MVRQKKNEAMPEMSRLEQEVMNEVWNLGECTSTEVIASYNRNRRLAPTTIRTVLSNLRKKGYLELVPTVERNYRLRAAVAREAVARRVMKSLVATLFGGSPRHAIAYLMNEETIREEDLAEIERLLTEHKNRKGNV